MDVLRFSDSNEILELAALSDIGDRDEQQDSFGHSLKDSECLAVVCDGMGGHKGGSLASAIAVDCIVNMFADAYPCEESSEVVKDSFAIADSRIHELRDENGNPLFSGTTAVSIIIKNMTMYWISVGDSRAYLFRENQSAQLTKDHTYLTVLEEQFGAGLIDENKYNEEKKKGGKLINYLGIGDLSLIDYNSTPFSLHKGDRVLLVSDGVYKHADINEITSAVNSNEDLSACLNTLAETINHNAKAKSVSRDNITAVLLKVK